MSSSQNSLPTGQVVPLFPGRTTTGHSSFDLQKEHIALEGGGGPPHDGGIDELQRRVGRLEAALERTEPMITEMHAQMPHLVNKADIEATKGELSAQIAKIDGGLAAKADNQHLSDVRAEAAEIKGRVASLPSTSRLTGLLTLALAGYAFVNYVGHWLSARHFLGL